MSVASDHPRPRSRAPLVRLFALGALAVLLAASLTACGDVQGVYTETSGHHTSLKGYTLTLEDGFVTMEAQGNAIAQGTYRVYDEQIMLTIGDEEDDEPQIGAIKGDSLYFGNGEVWTKQ